VSIFEQLCLFPGEWAFPSIWVLSFRLQMGLQMATAQTSLFTTHTHANHSDTTIQISTHTTIQISTNKTIQVQPFRSAHIQYNNTDVSTNKNIKYDHLDQHILQLFRSVLIKQFRYNHTDQHTYNHPDQY
jgi:hypothetical protein